MRSLEEMVSGFRRDTLLELMQVDPDKLEALVEGLSKRLYHVGHLGIDSNTFAYWKKMELLPVAQENKRWSRFSFFECVWLKTILEFRTLGIPMERIRKTKQLLWKSFEINTIKDYGKQIATITSEEIDMDTIFHDVTSQMVAEKQICPFTQMVLYCIVRKEGAGIFLEKSNGLYILPTGGGLSEEVGKFQEQLFFGSLVMVNIYPLIQQLCLLEQVVLPSQLSSYIITKEERRIIQAMRSGKYDEIIVRLSPDGKPTDISLNNGIITPEILAQVQPYLKRDSYKDIQFKVRGGRLVHYEQTELVKF